MYLLHTLLCDIQDSIYLVAHGLYLPTYTDGVSLRQTSLSLSLSLSLTVCVCGQQQTTNHMVDLCPLTKFGVGLQSLHAAGDDAIHWQEYTMATAFAQ